MMISLPRDVATNIKAFASDNYPPTPTASLIKTLPLKYEDAADNVVYLPRRLEVRATDSYFIRREIPSEQSLLTITRLLFK